MDRHTPESYHDTAISRTSQHKVIYSLTLSGVFIASIVAIHGGGISSAVGMLLIGMIIVLAGFLLHPWMGFIVAIIAELIIISTYHVDVVTILVALPILSLLTGIPWWGLKKVQRIEAQAQHAEIALLRQKLNFSRQQKTQAAEMQKLQLEEMLYMYHFAELGQLGVIVLHDMANHLSALALAIDELPCDRHVKTMARIKECLGCLNDIVDSTQERLHGGGTKEYVFDISQRISETITALTAKATKAHVAIKWRQPTGKWECTGDAYSLCQVVTIVINNAIDAYRAQTSAAALARARQVAVVMQRDNKDITIRISDWGKGISKQDRRNLFKPVHSTKKTGLGLGLYIAKQVIEMQFSGTISLNPHSRHTQFVIKIPACATLGA